MLSRCTRKETRVKTAKVAALVLALFVLLGFAGCSGLNSGSGTTQQLVEVTRGDLAVTVNGSGKLQAMNSRRLTFAGAGRVSKTYVREGQSVAKGDRIASLETDSLELAVAQAELALAQAEASVVQADAAVKAAQMALDDALGRPTVTEMETAQTDVDQARAYLQYLSNVTSASSPGQLPNQAMALAYAQQKLAIAEARLDALLTHKDTPEIAVKRAQVDSAQRAIEVSKQSVQLARISADYARKQLSESTVVAPISGALVTFDIKEGDPVSPAVIIGEIVDASVMTLDIQVDEIDVSTVKLGQRVIIDVDALPKLGMEGVVESIALTPSPQSVVVVYSTRIAFKVPANTTLRPGMSASADIVTSERKGVLLVPDRAIGKNTEGETIVLIPAKEKTEQKLVTIGVSNGLQTEITGGLAEGDTVVIERTNQPSGSLF
jgi:HlyD family secretion protein